MIHNFVTFPAFPTHFTVTFPRNCVRSLGISEVVLTLGAKDARPHTATKTQDLIKTLGWEQTDHPPYSPDLAPSIFNVFLNLKKFLGGRRFLEDDNVKEAANTRFSSQAASFYDAGIQELVPHYDKCLNNGGNYVEK
jgi:histone-lysine N-methyltransferase SETMAR